MIITTDFTVSGFGKRWAHCHQLANYLARYASASENDPERSSTLLSTFFNELLEAIYRNHAKQGQIRISFWRQREKIVLQAEIPVDDGSLDFYRRAVELMGQPDPMNWYRDRLENDLSEDEAMALGLLELNVVYGAKLSIADVKSGGERGGQLVLLVVDFPFTELDEV